jgi:hypothetical protein
MTLLLGMSKNEGLYMSADFRVTDARSGRLLDDSSPKFLTVHFPPATTGPKMLLAFTGVAVLRDGTPTGRWIRETLRGESEVVDLSMRHLLERLNRDVAFLGYPLIVNALVIEPQRRLFGGFSNVKRSGAGVEILSSFEYRMQEIDTPFLFANGSGAAHIAQSDLVLLKKQMSIIPRKPLDHMKLLATITRRTAQRDAAVSPFCNVSFVNSDDRTSPQSQTFTEKGEDVPFHMPLILFGLDLTRSTADFYEQATRSLNDGTAIAPRDVAEINEDLRRRP